MEGVVAGTDLGEREPAVVVGVTPELVGLGVVYPDEVAGVGRGEADEEVRELPRCAFWSERIIEDDLAADGTAFSGVGVVGVGDPFVGPFGVLFLAWARASCQRALALAVQLAGTVGLPAVSARVASSERVMGCG